jgi:hypothetical protein
VPVRAPLSPHAQPIWKIYVWNIYSRSRFGGRKTRKRIVSTDSTHAADIRRIIVAAAASLQRLDLEASHPDLHLQA